MSASTNTQTVGSKNLLDSAALVLSPITPDTAPPLSAFEVLEQTYNDLEKRFFAQPELPIAELETLIGRMQSYGASPVLGRAVIILGWANYVRGFLVMMLQNGYDAVQNYEALGNETRRANAAHYSQALRLTGTALSLLDRMNEALPRLADAVSIATIADAEAPSGCYVASRALFQAHLSLGTAFAEIGEWDSSIETFHHGFEMLETAVKWPAFNTEVMILRSNTTGALHARARLYQLTGQPELAAADIAAAQILLDEEAARHALQPNEDPNRARHVEPRYVGACGNQFLLAGDYQQARSCFERELNTSREPNFTDGCARVEAHIGLANVHLKLGSPDLALTHCHRALGELYDTKEPESITRYHLICAETNKALGNHAEAYEALERLYQVGVARQQVTAAWNDYLRLTTTNTILEIILTTKVETADLASAS